MKIFNLFVALIASITLFSQTKNGLEVTLKSFDSIMSHTAYSLSYNQKYHQANWVAYQLTRAETSNLFERENKFVADPLISETDLSLDYEK